MFRVTHTVRYEVRCPCGSSSGERRWRFVVGLWAWLHAWRSPRCRSKFARTLFGD